MDTTLGFPILVALIAVALLFDFLNGLHDAANSIATIVSTRVLRPHYAVFWAAFFNFVAFVVFGLNVAQTIGTGIIEPSVVDAQVVFAALVGAIVWNLITWWLGIPSSSSRRKASIASSRETASSAVQLASSVCPVRSSLINLDMPFLLPSSPEYTPQPHS